MRYHTDNMLSAWTKWKIEPVAVSAGRLFMWRTENCENEYKLAG